MARKEKLLRRAYADEVLSGASETARTTPRASSSSSISTKRTSVVGARGGAFGSILPVDANSGSHESTSACHEGSSTVRGRGNKASASDNLCRVPPGCRIYNPNQCDGKDWSSCYSTSEGLFFSLSSILTLLVSLTPFVRIRSHRSSLRTRKTIPASSWKYSPTKTRQRIPWEVSEVKEDGKADDHQDDCLHGKADAWPFLEACWSKPRFLGGAE